MLLATYLQQFDIELVDFLLISGTLGFFLFFLLGSLCAPLLAFTAEAAYMARHKAFYDKCGMQISQSALLTGLFSFVLAVATAVVFFSQNAPDMLTPPGVWRFPLFFGPAFGALLLLFLYSTLWNTLRKRRALHLSLGCLVMASNIVLLFAGFLLLAASQQVDAPNALWTTPLPLFLTLMKDFASSPQLMLLFFFFLCTGFAAGAGFAQLWLIARRFKADYGRDYYAFAMRFCARSALIFGILATGLAAGAFALLMHTVPPEFTQPADNGLLLVAAAVPLCACLLWFSIAKSDTPLRHKPAAFFACLFIAVALCTQILVLMESFPPM